MEEEENTQTEWIQQEVQIKIHEGTIQHGDNESEDQRSNTEEYEEQNTNSIFEEESQVVTYQNREKHKDSRSMGQNTQARGLEIINRVRKSIEERKQDIYYGSQDSFME